MKKRYFLRACKNDGTSYGEFKWDLTIGAVNTSPDWNSDPVCGGGLHGLENGVGDSSLLGFSEDSIFVVFSATADIVTFAGKSKVKNAKIEYVGELSSCAEFLYKKTNYIYWLIYRVK